MSLSRERRFKPGGRTRIYSTFTAPWSGDKDPQRHRLVLLDILRSLAIVLVVIGHLGVNPIYSIYPGAIGVSLFLILSGAALEYTHGNKHLQLVKFYRKRLLRIYPTYFIVLIMASFILGVKYLPQNFGDAILTLTGFCAFAGKWGCSLVETSWFIGLIVCLYLLYPFLSQSMGRRPGLTILAVISLTITSRLIVTHYAVLLPKETITWFPLCRLFEFSLGILSMKQRQVRTFLETFNLPIGGGLFAYLGKLSFPMFLVHFPLIKSIAFWRELGGPVFGIGVYFCLTVILSHIVMMLDGIIQRKIPLARFSVPTREQKELE